MRGLGRRVGLSKRSGSASTATSTPIPETITNLSAWFDPDSAYITKDGSDRVSSWVSREGNAYTLTAAGAAQPLWTDATIGTQPALYWTTDDAMSGAASLASSVAGNVDWTVFWISKSDDSAADYSCWGVSRSSDGQRYVQRQEAATPAQMQTIFNATFLNSTSKFTATTAATRCLRANAASANTVDLYAANVSLTGGAVTTWSTAANLFWIGASASGSTPSRFFKGYIAELFVYGKQLSVAEMTTLSNYAVSEYGVAA